MSELASKRRVTAVVCGRTTAGRSRVGGHRARSSLVRTPHRARDRDASHSDAIYTLGVHRDGQTGCCRRATDATARAVEYSRHARRW